MAKPKRPKKRLKKDSAKKAVAVEMKEAVKAVEVVEVVSPVPSTEVESRDARNLAMFKDWLRGKTLTGIAEEYKLSLNTVSNVSVQYNWKGLRKELRTRQFNAALDRIRDMTVFIQDALEADIRKIVKAAADGNKLLSKEERDHLRSMYDRILKEIRLDEGKPTDIGSTGTVKVEILLPPGVKRFGIMPPNPKVIAMEKVKDEKPVIDLDQLQEEFSDEDKS